MHAHYEDYFDDMREARVGPGSGYGYFYKDSEVIQHIRDVVHNLSDTFGNVTIPGQFASPNCLLPHVAAAILCEMYSPTCQ